MKEKLEDIICTSNDYTEMRPKAPRECGQTKDLIPNCVPLLGTADSGMGSVVTPCRTLGDAPPNTALLVVWRPQSKDSTPFYVGGQHIVYNGPPSRPNIVVFYNMQGEVRLLLPKSSMGTLLRRPPSRRRVYFYSFWGLPFVCNRLLDLGQKSRKWNVFPLQRIIMTLEWIICDI